ELDELQVDLQFARAEIVAVGKEGEDMRGLGDAEAVVHDEIGRGEGLEAGAAGHVFDERFGALFACHVLVVDLGGCEREADERAAAGDVRPVPELVAHAPTSPGASPGAKARMARAWTRWPGMSPSARLTRRWRARRFWPAKAALSMTTVKCDSPLPSSPAWP